MDEPAAAAGAETAQPSIQGPKPFSDISRSALANLKKKPASESPTANEERVRLREGVLHKIDEMEATLLKSMKFQVPRRFESRVDKSLHEIVSREGKKALAYCKAWAATPHRSPGALLMGKSGTFKTHILWATALDWHARAEARVKSHASELRIKMNHEIDQGGLNFSHDFNVHASRWPLSNLVTTDGAEIAHEVRSTVERKNLDEVVTRYRQEGWEPKSAALIVDDVEVMKLSDWLHEELYRIFDYRYQQSMPTMVATNLSEEELRRHLGDRLTRRILDMTEPFTL